MTDVQVPSERKREILDAHAEWLRSLPREPGQIGGAIGALIEGPAIHYPGEITTYSDFEPIRFVNVAPAFVDYLHGRGIPFQER